MEKKTKILMIITILAFVVLIGALCYGFLIPSEPEKKQQPEEQKQIETENVQEENNITDEQETNTAQNENMVTQEPVKKEPEKANVANENHEVIGKEEAESNVANEGKSEEEKAVDLVKEKWGMQDTTVTYTVANRENSIYMISVTNKETTAVLAWYQVNMATGEITQQ